MQKGRERKGFFFHYEAKRMLDFWMRSMKATNFFNEGQEVCFFINDRPGRLQNPYEIVLTAKSRSCVRFLKVRIFKRFF